MTQSIRDLLANRKFAIPLIGLLAFCLIGLLLLGVILVVKPGRAAAAKPTAASTLAPAARVLPTFTVTTVAQSPTARPTNTLVPINTVVINPTAVPTFPPEFGSATVAPTTTPGAAITGGSTASDATAVAATAVAAVTDTQLAQTGVGWGLIMASGVGLALVVVMARRLRLAG